MLSRSHSLTIFVFRAVGRANSRATVHLKRLLKKIEIVPWSAPITVAPCLGPLFEVNDASHS